MTIKELRKEFEKEFAALALKGVELYCAVPKKKGKHGMTKGAKDDEEIASSTHDIYISRPLIFDGRKIPETFYGFKIEGTTSNDSVPDEFKAYDEGLLPFDVCWSEEKIIAYAETHALEICEQLNDYTLTLKDICDILAGGDFERHKKLLEEEKALRLSGYYDEGDDFDFDDEKG